MLQVSAAHRGPGTLIYTYTAIQHRFSAQLRSKQRRASLETFKTTTQGQVFPAVSLTPSIGPEPPSHPYITPAVPYTPQLYEIQYHPFHHAPHEHERFMLNLANHTILAFSLVCREWHILSTQFLFETVHLSWYGSTKLREGLQRSVAGVSCGTWTRRLELSVVEHEDSDNPISPADIFNLCPNIDLLVKCEDDLLPHSIRGANLTGLKRFDWYYARYRDGDHQFATEDDDASRGQNFLRDVVKMRPTYTLSLHASFFAPTSLVLPALRTLHFQLISPDVWAEIETWSFPQLRVLRVDGEFLDCTRSSDRIWDTVRIVELLGDQGPIRAPSRIPSVLKICRNATELNYCIEYDDPAPADSTVAVPESEPLFDHIFAHLRMLVGLMFPLLKRVVLYGPWDFIVADERFKLFEKDLSNRGCRLDSEFERRNMD
ncbi:hypothetical protein K438DRAFT_1808822 [Mycena galopus ATCC 62051]|nr:hypothetical protein K438DRAFT_1808822 [Mycena galopus ATCC 62051]